MQIKALQKLCFYIVCLIVLDACTYYEKLQRGAKLSEIEKVILPSNLKHSDRYIGKSPLRYTFKFVFVNQQNQSFSLVFKLHDSSFPNSMLSILDNNQTQRHGINIGEENSIQKVLLDNLPDSKAISWQKYTAVSGLSHKDGYELMQEYIRFKLRDV